jgi:predicted nuclease of predicted toxin-antitoxin system
VELLQKARVMKRLFVTRDKDFGALVFLKEEIATGVIF